MNRVYAVNFDGTTFSETIARSARFKLEKGETITIRKPSAATSGGLLLFDAWASEGRETSDPDVDWLNVVSIWGSKGGSAFAQLFTFGSLVSPYATKAAAFAAVAAQFPKSYDFDDYDTIEIRIPQDGGIGAGGSNDNQGGVSFRVEIDDGTMFYDLVAEQPDAPIKEEWLWNTDTQVSFDGTEDPTPLLNLPKRTFSGIYSFDNLKDLRRYRANLQKTMNGIYRVPLFQYQVKAKQEIPAFSNYVFCNTIRGDFRDGCEALIREGDKFELVVIQSVLADRLVLGTTPLLSYSARALVCPVTRVFSASGQTLHRATVDDSGTAEFNQREWEPWDPFLNPQEAEALTTFDTMFVLDERAVGSQFDSSMDTGLQIADQYIGKADLLDPWTQGQVIFPLQWQINRVFDVHAWLWWQKFCNAIQGSQVNFLLPTFRPDLEIFTKAVGGGNTITLPGHEYRDHYYGLDTFARLVIESTAGRQFVKVTGLTNVSGNDRITFTPALAAGDWSEDQKVGFLLKVRNADDKVTVDHYGLHSNISMSLRTVK